MSLLGMIEYLRSHVKGLKYVLLIYLVVLVLFDLSLHLGEHAGHYYVDKIWDFWTIFGIIGCFVLIKVAKFIAHLFLSKNEDYYG